MDSSVLAGGGPGDFLTVRHLVLRGTQREIGRALADEVRARFPTADLPPDPALNRARRRWAEECWPEHHERMAGIADALGVAPDDDTVNLVELVAMPFRVGCSAVWCPAGTSIDGRPRLARNFDFRTDSVFEVLSLPHDEPQPAMFSAPYVIESYPTEGLASAVVAACDLTGCFDGINEAGLAVTLLADDETTDLRPAFQSLAGLHELQVPRFLLDRCRDVGEAIEALRCAKQYDNLFPCHYVVADRHGDAFVWERDTHNAEHVVQLDADGPACVTNYLLHRHESIAALPDDDPRRPDGLPFAVGMYERARTLDRATSSASTLTERDLWAAIDEVAVPTDAVGARTIWQVVFDLEARSMTLRCYLGDKGDVQRRSEPVTITLESRGVSVASSVSASGS